MVTLLMVVMVVVVVMVVMVVYHRFLDIELKTKIFDVSRCSEIVNDENVEVICQSSNAREQSVSSEHLSTHQIFFQPC